MKIVYKGSNRYTTDYRKGYNNILRILYPFLNSVLQRYCAYRNRLYTPIIVYPLLILNFFISLEAEHSPMYNYSFQMKEIKEMVV